MTQKQIEARQNAIKTVSPKLAETVNAYLPEDKKFDVDSVSREVANYDQWPEEYRVLGAMSAAVVPDLIESLKANNETIASLKAELTKIRGAAPKAGGGGNSSVQQEKPAQAGQLPKLGKNSETSFIRDLSKRVAGSQF
jgi:hypothetical protein